MAWNRNYLNVLYVSFYQALTEINIWMYNVNVIFHVINQQI